MNTMINARYQLLCLILLSCTVYGQQAFQNFGTVQIHTNAQIGFHVQVINKGEIKDHTAAKGVHVLGAVTIAGNAIEDETTAVSAIRKEPVIVKKATQYAATTTNAEYDIKE